MLRVNFSPVYPLNKKVPSFLKLETFVGPLGLEPRLFCTKNRRVASYTMGQYRNAVANLIQTFSSTNKNDKKSFFNVNFLKKS
tara:strand:+ start:317 stop:565 length:249 start_codon:yes stop_codon:yes gene_type:complete